MEGLKYNYIDPELINEFRLPALQFEKTNKYTNLIPGTYSYKKFWDNELERVVEGYKIGDNYISGYNYNYWNYSRIKKVVPVIDKYGKLKYQRKEGFPNPFDYDKFYFDYLDEAENNGNHACVLKARGKGYSFKGASMLIRNYEFIPGSSSYVFVSDKNYLIKDGILNKAWYMMDFLEKTTPFAKRRIVNQDLHRKSGYTIIQDGVSTEMGYLSEIIGISIGDDPDKVRGKRGKLILFEEAGSFNHLQKSYIICRPSVEDGDYVFGLIVVFGTGGDEKMASSQGLENLFFYPKANNILELPNIWSKHNFTSKTCAFFVPITANYSGHYDEVTGISDHESARKAVEKKYDSIVKNSKDSKTAVRYKAENCIEPEDAILKISGNRFPITDINHRIAELMNGKELSTVKHGTLHYDSDGIVVFKHDMNASVITDFPLIDGNKTGAISIFEEPVRNSNGDIPYGIYIAGNDPYDDDESTTDSLGSTFIMNKLTRRIVAEYTGRPATAYEYYENVLRLLKYYNATVNYEQNKKGLYNYFYNNNALLYLADTPKILKDRGLITFSGSGNKLKGTNANTNVNNWGRELSKMYLLSKVDQNGPNYVSTILSIPLLKELKFWNPDQNFDRVSALGMLLIYEQEVLKYSPDIEVIKDIKSSDFFNRNYQKRAINMQTNYR